MRSGSGGRASWLRGRPRTASYGFAFIEQKGREILGCPLKPGVVEWLFDRSYIDGWTVDRLIADLQDSARRGLQASLCI